MQEQIRKHGVVRIYSCGGGGINIGHIYSNQAMPNEAAAIVKTTFLDTSDSNIRKKDLPSDEVYLIKNLKRDNETDGAGKVRAEHAEAIVKEVPKILVEHKPEDLNVVVFTGGGGSGSVIGPVLVSALMERGRDVIAVVIGVTEDDTSIENTFNTLKSLESNVETFGRTVSLRYIPHRPGMTRDQVNSAAQFFISVLCILASRRNDELDTADVSRYLNYNTVPRSELAPQLTLLNLYTSAQEVEEKSPDVFAMALVLRDTEQAVPDKRLAYKCTGYMPEGAFDHNFYFTSEVGGLNAIQSELRSYQREIKESRVARSTAGSFRDESDKPVAAGLVL